MTKTGTILVIEDERDYVDLLRYNLEREGYRVIAAKSAEAGRTLAAKERPDMIVLDVMLPRADGFDFCGAIRRESDVPILFLTAKKSKADRMLAFQLGADDYLTKPFSVWELLARTRVLLRRRQAQRQTGAVMRIGDLEIDPQRREVRVRGEAVLLTRKEFDFVRFLAAADGRLVSREVLLKEIWGYDKTLAINTRTVDQHAARLRRKLKLQTCLIQTVPNFGYRLVTRGR